MTFNGYKVYFAGTSHHRHLT